MITSKGTNRMLIDFHTHAFPDAIAAKAIDKLSYVSGGLIPQGNGTVSSLKQEMKKDGVDISVVLSIATNPMQQANVNNFANEINKEKCFFAFGSVHPDADEYIMFDIAGKAILDGVEYDVPAGGLVHAISGVKHECVNTDPERTLNLFCVFVPAFEPYGAYPQLIEKTKKYLETL